jgi:cytochrome c biogenesis protein CcdA
MILVLTSFLAGVLTIGAPCVLPVLPIIIGGSVSEADKKKPYIIIASLSLSLIIFTLLLKASTLLIMVSPKFWAAVSGSIVLVFGIFTLWPHLWEKISDALKLSSTSNALLNQSTQKGGIIGSILIGAALGPVFSSCSPTYALIVATVLPQNFLTGLFYITIYVLGLALMLLLIAVFGQRLVAKLKWLADPESKFKKALGALFIIIGLLILTGTEKRIETYLVESGIYNVSQLELNLLNKSQN